MAWTIAVSGRRLRRRGVDSYRLCGDQQHSVDQQLLFVEVFEIVGELASDLRDQICLATEFSRGVLRRGFEPSVGQHTRNKEFRLVAELFHLLNVVSQTFSIRQSGI